MLRLVAQWQETLLIVNTKYTYLHWRVMGLQDKTQKLFDKAVELDKKILKKVEDKLNLSDYQSKCANFVLGFIIGAILL